MIDLPKLLCYVFLIVLPLNSIWQLLFLVGLFHSFYLLDKIHRPILVGFPESSCSDGIFLASHCSNRRVIFISSVGHYAVLPYLASLHSAIWRASAEQPAAAAQLSHSIRGLS